MHLYPFLPNLTGSKDMGFDEAILATGFWENILKQTVCRQLAKLCRYLSKSIIYF